MFNSFFIIITQAHAVHIVFTNVLCGDTQFLHCTHFKKMQTKAASFLANVMGIMWQKPQIAKDAARISFLLITSLFHWNSLSRNSSSVVSLFKHGCWCFLTAHNSLGPAGGDGRLMWSTCVVATPSCLNELTFLISQIIGPHFISYKLLCS